MNTTLSTAPGRHDHPPQPPYDHEPRRARRVSLLDRLALHVGIALIKWGRRPRPVEQPHPAESVEWRASRAEQQSAELARDRAVTDALQLSLRLR